MKRSQSRIFGILLLCVGAFGLYWKFSSPSPSKTDPTPISDQQAPNTTIQTQMVRQFGQSVAAVLKSGTKGERSLEDMILSLLSASGSADSKTQRELREKLLADRKNTVPVLVRMYESAAGEVEKRDQFLELANVLCLDQSLPSCASFLSREAFNENLLPNQRLSCLKTYFSGDIGLDTKVSEIAKFKATIADPEMMAEVDTLGQPTPEEPSLVPENQADQ